MVRLNGKAEVNLLSSNGDVLSLGGTNSMLISVDVSKDEEIKLTSSVKSFNFTSKNCMFDKRTIDYICGFLSPTEYKMPKKKNRKSARMKKKFKKTKGVVLRMEC